MAPEREHGHCERERERAETHTEMLSSRQTRCTQDVINLSVVTFNIFQITPKVVLLVLPYRRVTPLLQTGFGGTFMSSGFGSYGRWLAGAGVAMAIAERLTLRLGVDVEGLVPDARFAQKFECRLANDPCSLGLSPWIGVGLRF